MASSTGSDGIRGVSRTEPGDMTLHEALRHHAFARGLGEEQIATLASMASHVTFTEGEVILENGQRSHAFFLVLTGSVSVELCTARFIVSVQSLGPGQVFGWSALLDHHDTVFQVRARENTTALRLQ